MRITHEDGSKTSTGEPSPRVCMQVLEFLKKEMQVLTSGMKHTRYKFRVLCWTSLREMHFHDLEECLENVCIPCGKELITTIKLQKMFKNKQLVTDSSMPAAGSSDAETAPPDLQAEFIEETRNFQAIQSLIIDFGTKKMKDFFLKTAQQTSSSFVEFLKNEKEKGSFENMEHFQGEDKMFSPDADIDTFDIDILMTLIRYCCGSTFSDDMWQQPHTIRSPVLANLFRISQYKKTKLDQNTSCRIPTKDFEDEWKRIKEIFLNLGITSKEIEDIRHKKGFDKTTITEMQNFQAVMSLVVDLGTDVMRKYFLRVNNLKEKNVGQFLMNQKSNFRKARLFKDQENKMFTPNADINSFDISIMIKIIRYCKHFPDSFWSQPENHDNVLPNLVRIHQYRNTKLAHSASARMPTNVFEVEWRKLTSILQGAGVPLEKIDAYKQLRLVI
ncbi:uncharacterized protein LOC117111496 [Anneissia japonica]|uniref:uncharacterized protein LOC117111496 n=1 Tax=Anneissia japonica TaxID=1529436 RepID=UPI00142559FD|nr:uncharacterized protein LOC117111496 [Anneissia japonica]